LRNGEIKSNYYLWREQWGAAKIANYGKEFVNQFEERSVYEFDLSDELMDLEMQSELNTSTTLWLPTAEQRNEILAIQNPMEQEWRQRELYLQWADGREEENKRIKYNNNVNQERRKIIIAKNAARQDTVARLISDVLGSMATDVRELVEAYKRNFADGEYDKLISDGLTVNTTRYGMELARRSGNWLWTFEAAEAICITRVTEDTDPMTKSMRKLDERKKLDKLYHSAGKYAT
jgi:hypothetical protein